MPDKWKILKILKGHTGTVYSVGFNHDGTKIVSGSWDKTIRVWNVDTGECILTLKGHTGSVNSVGFNHDGTKIVSGSDDQTIRVWNVDTGECILTLKGHTSSVFSVGFNHDGTKIVSGSYDKTIRVWNVDTGECILTLKGHTSYVNSVGFNHDGTKIVSGSNDNTIRVWNVDTGECILTLKGHTDYVRSVGFNHDGTKIVSGSYDNTIRVWNVDTGECILTLKGHTSYVNSVGFNHDGTKIVSGSKGNTIRIWNVDTGECILTLKGHTGGVWSVAFNHDGTKIVSGSKGNTIRIWKDEDAATTSPAKALQLLPENIRPTAKLVLKRLPNILNPLKQAYIQKLKLTAQVETAKKTLQQKQQKLQDAQSQIKTLLASAINAAILAQVTQQANTIINTAQAELQKAQKQLKGKQSELKKAQANLKAVIKSTITTIQNADKDRIQRLQNKLQQEINGQTGNAFISLNNTFEFCLNRFVFSSGQNRDPKNVLSYLNKVQTRQQQLQGRNLTLAQLHRKSSDTTGKTVAISNPKLFDFSYLAALANLKERSGKIETNIVNRNEMFFDVIVIGAGVHEQIFQNTLRSENSKLRVLTIERGEIPCETFSAASDRVNSNSSVRMADEDVQAIPSVGNINTFFLGLLQLDDVTADGLGPLGNFAKVATINRSLSNNDILFGWEVVTVTARGRNNNSNNNNNINVNLREPLKRTKQYEVQIRRRGTARNTITIYCPVVVDARGIGVPKFPPINYGNQRVNTVATDFRQQFYANPSVETFPKVVHSKDFYEMTTLLNDPYGPFANKKVAVVGSGDSGKTIMEFLTRVGVGAAGFGGGNIAGGTAIPIWIGQKDRTQAEYEATSRARYRPLGAKFPRRASDNVLQGACPLIKAFPGRLNRITQQQNGKLSLRISQNNNTNIEVDVVVLATGLLPDYTLFQNFPGIDSRRQITNETQSTERIDCEQLVGVKRVDASPFAIIPLKRIKDSNVFFIGPGGGDFINNNAVLLRKIEKAGKDLGRPGLGKIFGISENVVAIFALGPISEYTARFIDVFSQPDGQTRNLQQNIPIAQSEIIGQVNRNAQVDLIIPNILPSNMLQSIISRVNDQELIKEFILLRVLYNLFPFRLNDNLRELVIKIRQDGNTLQYKILDCQLDASSRNEFTNRCTNDKFLSQSIINVGREVRIRINDYTPGMSFEDLCKNAEDVTFGRR